MFVRWLQYLVGVFRRHASVRVLRTNDVVEMVEPLGTSLRPRHQGRLRVVSQRNRIQVVTDVWWLPNWCVDSYGVYGEITSEEGSVVSLTPLALPGLLPFPLITGKASHSMAIELFLRAVVSLGESNENNTPQAPEGCI